VTVASEERLLACRVVDLPEVEVDDVLLLLLLLLLPLLLDQAEPIGEVIGVKKPFRKSR
jgi:hypothetical protein